MAALGSSHMFSDQYLDKEDNGKIMVSLGFGLLFKTLLWIFTTQSNPKVSLQSKTAMKWVLCGDSNSKTLRSLLKHN